MLLGKNRQAGSTTTFVIVAIILVAVTISGIAFVVGRGEQARKDAAASRIAAQEAADKKAKDAEETAKNTPTPNKPAPTTDTPTSTQTDSDELPVTGPEFDAARTLVAALLVGTLTSFVISRRTLKRSL